MAQLKRIVAVSVGAVGTANGVFMLAARALWYDSVPGLAHTGPSIRISSPTSARRISSPASR